MDEWTKLALWVWGYCAAVLVVVAIAYWAEHGGLSNALTAFVFAVLFTIGLLGLVGRKS